MSEVQEDHMETDLELAMQRLRAETFIEWTKSASDTAFRGMLHELERGQIPADQLGRRVGVGMRSIFQDFDVVLRCVGHEPPLGSAVQIVQEVSSIAVTIAAPLLHSALDSQVDDPVVRAALVDCCAQAAWVLLEIADALPLGDCADFLSQLRFVAYPAGMKYLGDILAQMEAS